jgi:hypothetical protein
VQRQAPHWDEIADLERILNDEGEEAFSAKAREAGLIPDRVRLFIDMLNAKPADRDAILSRIESLYGPWGVFFLKEKFEKFIHFDDSKRRKESIDDQRKSLLADAPEREVEGKQAFDVTREIVGVLGGRSRRRRSPGRKSRPQKSSANLKPGPGYRPDRKFITPDDFRKLPDKGFVDPQRIRTSQERFNEEFGKPFIPGVPESKKIGFLVDGLKSGRIKPQDVDPIMLVEWRGDIYSTDHRRLIAFRRAGFDIPFVKVKMENLSKGKKDRIRGARKFNDNGSYIPNEVTGNME